MIYGSKMNAISSNTEPDAGCGFPQRKKTRYYFMPLQEKSIALFGAVQANTGQMVSMMTSIFNAETFLEFLKMVLKKRKRGRKLILDNARYHYATMIRPWLNRNKKWIKLIFLFLPPYSSDL